MSFSTQIKIEAQNLGFDACGICRAVPVSIDERERYNGWIRNGNHAGMSYLERNIEKRFDVQKLLPGAKSIVCVAINYYPANRLPDSVPQFAYYAYGKDYHKVVKDKLYRLLDYVGDTYPDVSARCFADSAPVMERYWAEQAGLGFVGKNGLLIIKNRGSFFLLGELILDIELDYDKPVKAACGSCTRCIDSCPTGALYGDCLIDASRCISYNTIENRGEIPKEVTSKMNNNLFGCDICQKVCPWNRFAKPTTIPDFAPSEEFMKLTEEKLQKIDEEEFMRLFSGTAVMRTGYHGLKRNLRSLTD